MASIGSLFLMLGAKSEALESDLSKAQQKIDRFAKNSHKSLSRAGGDGGGLMGGLSSLAGSVGPAALAGGAALFGVGLGAAGIGAALKDQMHEVLETSRAAEQLGVSTRALTGLQLAA